MPVNIAFLKWLVSVVRACVFVHVKFNGKSHFHPVSWNSLFHSYLLNYDLKYHFANSPLV